ncbi:apolipoprotein A-I-like [Heptranchias perlo]|uniref:apolipoprotein A-I-like n=1 Tax=Heptranchias perlo TaxID=212740 RepID=UPI00355A0DF5
MKIFAVTLVLLVVKGTQGGVIPKDESKSNKSANWQQPFWDLLNIGNDLAQIAVGILEQSDVAKSAMEKLSSTNRNLDAMIENSVKDLSSLTKELQWKGVSISDHIKTQANLVHARLTSVGEQLHEAIGNETTAAIHEKLEMLHKDIRQYSQNLSLITDHFNQSYGDATHQLEEWYKKAAPSTEELREEISELIEELRQYLSPMVHETKEGFKKLEALLTKWREAPLPTDAP